MSLAVGSALKYQAMHDLGEPHSAAGDATPADPSRLAREIAAQPSAIARFLDQQGPRVLALAAALPRFSHIVVVARGTSGHAATYARFAWGCHGGFSVAAANPALHTIYRRAPHFADALVVAISQSGQSPDVVAVIEDARRQNRPTIAITNDPRSPLAHAADHVIDLGVTETSIAATGTYTCQLAAIAVLAAAWSQDPRHAESLARLPDAMAGTLDLARGPCADVAGWLHTSNAVVTLARGLNEGTAQEWALKLRELLRLHTHAFSAAEFRHGSIALAGHGLTTALIMPSGEAYADMVALGHELARRGAQIIAISDHATRPFAQAAWLPLVPGLPEWLSPLTAILPGQLLGLALAHKKGLDPDRPAGLPEKIIRTI